MSNYDSYGTPNKPDSNCRTCTDFKYWSKQQRQMFNKSPPEKGVGANINNTRSVHSSNDNGNGGIRDDCPLDKSALGKATWGLLHTMAAFYDDSPTDRQKRDVKTFLEVLSRVYPCEYCAADFRKDLAQNPVNADSQKELSLWMCNFHNRVNKKLGKRVFDCSRVNERWRDGWLDGSCD